MNNMIKMNEIEKMLNEVIESNKMGLMSEEEEMKFENWLYMIKEMIG